MNPKIVAVQKLKELVQNLSGRIGALHIDQNIFSGPKAEIFMNNLLEAAQKGVNLRKLFSQIPAIRFLGEDKPPSVENGVIPIREKNLARRSIYFCLENLNQKNKEVILQKLFRNFLVLGYKQLRTPDYLEFELIEAVSTEDTQRLWYLIQQGADIDVMLGREEGIKPEQRTTVGDSAGSQRFKDRPLLVNLARRGTPELVSILIQAGANVNALDNCGGNAVIEAAGHGHLRIVKDLINAGSDLQIKNVNGWTACNAAKATKNTEIYNLLKKHGARED
ncbi:MAG: ankyrin repeat domain-containing protein [Candidatus Margulisbacteria bacterium]|nr:ankyrin repeat domain-containing protein [Candidatus Margulisiibacteriota bacterium]